MRQWTVVAVFLVGAWAQAYPEVPDPQLTLGGLCSTEDRDYLGRKYPEQIEICRRNVDGRLKDKVYEAYSIPERCRRRFTIDHFIPLSIGGNNSFANLWPEHRLVKERRQFLEQEVFDAVAVGKMSQDEAIERIRRAKLHPDPVLFRAPNGGDPVCDRPQVRQVVSPR